MWRQCHWKLLEQFEQKLTLFDLQRITADMLRMLEQQGGSRETSEEAVRIIQVRGDKVAWPRRYSYEREVIRFWIY